MPGGVEMRTLKLCTGEVEIVVDDYDRAIEFYPKELGFTLVKHIKSMSSPDYNEIISIIEGVE
jgi:predicted enzyme related to lactoylglutathione lyase